MGERPTDPAEALASGPPGGVKRTPAFSAMSASRYLRQDLIKKIEEATGAQLLCYIGGSNTSVRRDDVVLLVDLLHNVKRGQPIDLMLHTPGGDVDAAEKLLMMVHEAAGSSPLRVIVPDHAKSAGTLMALGADTIVMSESSELGPIDPQVVWEDRGGVVQVTAIQNYLDSFQEWSQIVNSNAEDQAARMMLDKFDPARVHQFRAAIQRARNLAEKLLLNRMYREGDGSYTAVAGSLMDTKQYQSHSQMIGYAEAKKIGLKVTFLPPEDALWQNFWLLYCYQRLEVVERYKLFESRYASLREMDPT